MDLSIITIILSDPQTVDSIALGGAAIALILGWYNHRRINTIAKTPALKDHLRKRK